MLPPNESGTTVDRASPAGVTVLAPRHDARPRLDVQLRRHAAEAVRQFFMFRDVVEDRLFRSEDEKRGNHARILARREAVRIHRYRNIAGLLQRPVGAY